MISNLKTISALLISLLFTGPVLAESSLEEAILAGGCFWCIEADLEKLDGVKEVVSGYSGGHTENPTYKTVSTGTTGHIEVVKVIFDPNVITYEKILHFFWRHVDPTRDDGQFCDNGEQYRPAILYKPEQKAAADASLMTTREQKPFEAPLKVELLPFKTFYEAEDYHQDYYKKNPLRYRYYRFSCGRDQRIEELWGTEDKS